MMVRMVRFFLAAVVTLVLCAIAVTPGHASEARSPVSLRAPAPWTGDFDGMQQRRLVRVLAPYSDTQFFFSGGRQRGVAAEFAQMLEDWLNRRNQQAGYRRHLRFVVAITPMPRDKLFDALNRGIGDVVMANLTITDERRNLVDFTRPWLTDVKEVVVTGPAGPELASIEDLAGKTIPLRNSSSYATHVRELSARFVAAGRQPVRIEPLPDDLEDERILDMVHAGLLPMAIVDDHKARVWANVFPKLRVRTDLAVSAGGEIAWAIRKNSPLLKAQLDEFLSRHSVGTSFGNTIRRRYFGGSRAARPATSDGAMQRFNGLEASFRRHGTTSAIDPLLLAAQGFQESGLVQSRRSPRGAVGIMQLLPSTAAAPPVSVRNVATDADANIMAGARYMRHLIDAYVNDPGLDPLNRTLMAFAAYNAGPGNLRKIRRTASAMGLDPNVWINNAELAAARVIGRETVQYVANIYKYYIAYNLSQRALADNRAASAPVATPARDAAPSAPRITP